MLDAHFFPYPRGFKIAAKVRFEESGDVVYIWHPIARKYFTALGMVLTSTPQQPHCSLIRTVPLSLTQPSQTPPNRLARRSNPQLYVNSAGFVVIPTLSGSFLNLELINQSGSQRDPLLSDVFGL
mmetsp:Transcript_39189/g.54654  ORF Transcript_39189/g.54654 Transcript_39189/m.54654 type:complete len:125 (+) Transcript_39189:193-567(+)